MTATVLSNGAKAMIRNDREPAIFDETCRSQCAARQSLLVLTSPWSATGRAAHRQLFQLVDTRIPQQESFPSTLLDRALSIHKSRGAL